MRPGLHARVVALLVAARRDHGLTQADLARRLDRSANFVSRVEAGARHLDVAEFIAIARALDIDPYALVRQAEAQG